MPPPLNRYKASRDIYDSFIQDGMTPDEALSLFEIGQIDGPGRPEFVKEMGGTMRILAKPTTQWEARQRIDQSLDHLIGTIVILEERLDAAKEENEVQARLLVRFEGEVENLRKGKKSNE